jgi:hypothetical protein
LGNKFREIVKEEPKEKKVTEKKQESVKNPPIKKGFLYKTFL